MDLVKLVAAISLIYSCSLRLDAQRTEKYRPQYHFSPNSGWIGDPDGLIHYRGIYHLFWWGHATSTDMVHWTELPYPILGDGGAYQVTTGSAVIDKDNVSSLGVNSFLNFHTLWHGAEGVGLSTSLDSANDFIDFPLYGANPILRPPSPGVEFRDPQVFWHAPTKSWVMLVATGAERQIRFYRSGDLLHWTPSGFFGPEDGSIRDIWETPDLFQLPVDGSTSNKRWILSVGVKDHMRYFVGNFDGSTFTNAYPGKTLLTDAGPDFYAARTWRDYDADQSRTTLLGWMGNWDYSTVSPSRLTYGGTGASSVPRDLALRTYSEGIRLVQIPIPELQPLRQSPHSVSNVIIIGTHPISDFVPFHPSQNAYEIDTTFTITSTARIGFNFLVDSTHKHFLTVEYDPSSSTLSVDRTHSSDATLNASFPSTVSASLLPVNHQLRLHMFIDKSSIEIFSADGKFVLTLLTYPSESQLGIEVFARNDHTTLASFTGWELSSIWTGMPTNRIQSGGIYELKARHDGEVLNTPASDNLTGLRQSVWLGRSNQKWKVEIVESGHYDTKSKWVPSSYRFTNQSNGKQMESRAPSASNPATIQQSDRTDTDSQKWQIEEIGGNFYKVISKAPSANGQHLCLEVEDASNEDGHPVHAGRFMAYHHQEWQFLLLAPPR